MPAKSYRATTRMHNVEAHKIKRKMIKYLVELRIVRFKHRIVALEGRRRRWSGCCCSDELPQHSYCVLISWTHPARVGSHDTKTNSHFRINSRGLPFSHSHLVQQEGHIDASYRPYPLPTCSIVTWAKTILLSNVWKNDTAGRRLVSISTLWLGRYCPNYVQIGRTKKKRKNRNRDFG